MTDSNNEKLIAQLMEASRAGRHLPYGSFSGPREPFDLQDANIGLLDFGRNDVELEWLRKIGIGNKACTSKYPRTLTDVIFHILGAETKFDLSNYELAPSVGGFRHAFVSLASRLVNSERPLIAYASPNWIFDRVIAEVPGAQGAPFFALSAGEFVERVKSLPDKDKTAALVIVDPSNPLGYRLSQTDVTSIEEIALREGIVPIFDDVFRGMQVSGDRHSSSEYSQNSIVIETTSKRFGARGLGVTWSLIPKKLRLDSLSRIAPQCNGCSARAAMVTEALYTTGYGKRVQEQLAQGTRAFIQGASDHGLANLADRGIFNLAFEGMPFFTYHLPRSVVTQDNISFLIDYMNLASSTIGVVPGYEWIVGCEARQKAETLHREEIGTGLSYVRICPTKEPTNRLYQAGAVFGLTTKVLMDEISRK